MSREATGWVWEHSKMSGNDLIVLLKIADNANADGGGAYPGIAYLARHARVSRRTVFDCLRRLKASGELVEEDRGGGRLEGYKGRKTTYRVVIGADAAPYEDEDNGEEPAPLEDSVTVQPDVPTVQPDVANGADPRGAPIRKRTSLNLPKNRRREPSETAWDLARLLAESVERRFPQFGKPKIGLDWAKEVDLLLRKGPPQFEKGLEERQVRKLIAWLDAGQGRRAAFWAGNIRSAKKLRDKAPELVAGWYEDHGMLSDGRPLPPRNGNGSDRRPPLEIPEADLASRPPRHDPAAMMAWSDRQLEEAGRT